MFMGSSEAVIYNSKHETEALWMTHTVCMTADAERLLDLTAIKLVLDFHLEILTSGRQLEFSIHFFHSQGIREK